MAVCKRFGSLFTLIQICVSAIGAFGVLKIVCAPLPEVIEIIRVAHIPIAEVITARLNLHAGPGTGHDILKKLRKGE